MDIHGRPVLSVVVAFFFLKETEEEVIWGRVAVGVRLGRVKRGETSIGI